MCSGRLTGQGVLIGSTIAPPNTTLEPTKHYTNIPPTHIMCIIHPPYHTVTALLVIRTGGENWKGLVPFHSWLNATDPTEKPGQWFWIFELLPRNWIDHSSKTRSSRSVVEDFNPDRRSCFKMLINFDQKKKKSKRTKQEKVELWTRVPLHGRGLSNTRRSTHPT